MGLIRFIRQSEISISSDGYPFKVGNTPNNNTSKTLPLKATITWPTSSQYNDLRDEVNDGEGFVIPFNPCNPYYGLYNYTEADGTLAGSAFLDWFTDGGYDAWLEYEGYPADTLTESQSDAAAAGISEIIDSYIANGLTLNCLISSVG